MHRPSRQLCSNPMNKIELTVDVRCKSPRRGPSGADEDLGQGGLRGASGHRARGGARGRQPERPGDRGRAVDPAELPREHPRRAAPGRHRPHPSGSRGGSSLARPADAITVGEILLAIDGPLAAVRDLPPEQLVYEGSARRLPEVWCRVRGVPARPARRRHRRRPGPRRRARSAKYDLSDRLLCYGDRLLQLAPVLSPCRTPCGVSPPGAPLGRRGETTGAVASRRAPRRRGARTMTAVPSRPRPPAAPVLDDARHRGAPRPGPGSGPLGGCTERGRGRRHRLPRLPTAPPVGEGRGYANVVAASSDGAPLRDPLRARARRVRRRVARASRAGPAPRRWLADLREQRHTRHVALVGRRARCRRSGRPSIRPLARTVFAGDALTAVKDPVVKVVDGLARVAVRARRSRSRPTPTACAPPTARATTVSSGDWHGTALAVVRVTGTRVASRGRRGALARRRRCRRVLRRPRAPPRRTGRSCTGIAAGAPGALRAAR